VQSLRVTDHTLQRQEAMKTPHSRCQRRCVALVDWVSSSAQPNGHRAVERGQGVSSRRPPRLEPGAPRFRALCVGSLGSAWRMRVHQVAHKALGNLGRRFCLRFDTVLAMRWSGAATCASTQRQTSPIRSPPIRSDASARLAIDSREWVGESCSRGRKNAVNKDSNALVGCHVPLEPSADQNLGS